MPPLSVIAVPYFTTAYDDEKAEEMNTIKGGFLRLVSPI